METYNIAELSDFLKCSISEIRKLVRNNSIPYYRIGRKLFFKRTSIESWIEHQEQFNEIIKNYESEVS